jgi:hypothetical protein
MTALKRTYDTSGKSKDVDPITEDAMRAQAKRGPTPNPPKPNGRSSPSIPSDER